ncbi:putative enzyme related to lactoylglutathione lyase [Allocatelliglobosispora scoriae]|uniref:Putative enzyme related to lactoylglutathione lyase n=1 Tax=Allocatelliglobosispora scoriae TaxID=643052 RepID=A0A841BRL3_9ACTN|nr:glyoxalase superfamily protein [Allocatelliglobosispora scoriae]MBB5870038.1 putative enzyme related to lactoylglutathione lyase [Allocatelliglobosispora scoriae]
MDWKLELVPIPVADVDRAKAFYADQVGFTVDHDHNINDELRIVQLTPPGSGCSILLSKGVIDTKPGSIQNVHIVVNDIETARASLIERGVDVSEVKKMSPEDGGTFVFFSDPDGNSWAVQEMRNRV